MESPRSPEDALALLAWQIELGADEAIGDAPVDRYALPAESPNRTAAQTEPAAQAVVAPAEEADPVTAARTTAAASRDLAGLASAMEAFEHCALKRGARSFVLSDGNPVARVMIVGEAPGRDEDRIGRPFVGRAGQLLDRMLAPIGLDRTATDAAHAVYITNVLPWRPPQNRTPEPAEIAMMLPFLEAHIALADPEVLILMGNTPCQTLLGRSGITRMRGHWTEALNRPVLPMFHPAYLLRNPAAKREAWADLLDLQARLRDGR